MRIAVLLNLIPKRGLPNPVLTGHLSDPTTSFHHLLRGLLTKLRRELLIPSHNSSPFPERNLCGPQSGKLEARQLDAGGSLLVGLAAL